MISFLSSWAKGIGLAVVVVSILEMILPNNKTKKYVKMVMGVFVLFCIISPFFKNINDFSFLEIENTINTLAQNDRDPSTMDAQINKLYEEQIEKDIKNKLKQKGYQVNDCKVDLIISEENDKTKINNIKLKVEPCEIKENENTIETKIVKEVEKVKKVNINVTKNENKEDVYESKLSKTQLKEIVLFISEEYGVNEECLIIN